MQISNSVRALLSTMLESILVPCIFPVDEPERRNHSGSVEVEGKLYALFFTRVSETEVEVSITRNSNVIKLIYRKDMFTQHLTTIEHLPPPGACGYAKYLSDPWLWMRVFVEYVEKNPYQSRYA